MSAKNGKLETTITTPKFRNSFPAIFSPKLNKLNGKMEYSLQALFPKNTDLEPMRKMAHAACVNKWGPDQKKWPTKLLSPFKKQDDLIEAAKKKDRDHSHLEVGAFYMTFKTDATDKNGKPKTRPIVVGKNPKITIEEESKFYGGCWAKALVNANAYEKGINTGVTFYLNACQFVDDGQPFGSTINPESAFEAIPEDATNETGSAAEMFR